MARGVQRAAEVLGREDQLKFLNLFRTSFLNPRDVAIELGLRWKDVDETTHQDEIFREQFKQISVDRHKETTMQKFKTNFSMEAKMDLLGRMIQAGFSKKVEAFVNTLKWETAADRKEMLQAMKIFVAILPKETVADVAVTTEESLPDKYKKMSPMQIREEVLKLKTQIASQPDSGSKEISGEANSIESKGNDRDPDRI